MIPKRIQRKRTKGWKMPENTKSVTRPGKWGNWLIVQRIDPERKQLFDTESEWEIFNSVFNKPVWMFGDRAWCIERAVKIHRSHIGEVLVKHDIKQLTGFNLACFCPLCEKHKDGRPWNEPCDDCPPCHADVLLELANQP